MLFMEIEFKDKKLEKIENGSAADVVTSGVPLQLVEILRKRLILLRAAPDERTIRNWKGLHYEKLKGNRSHQRSIRLNGNWRLILEIGEGVHSKTIFIVKVEDYH